MVFILIFASVTESFGNTCSYLFTRPIDAIERANKEYNGKISNDAPVEYQIQNLKNRQRKKAQKLLDRVFKGDIVSAKDLETVAINLTNILYGRKDTIDRYFLKNASQREVESFRWKTKKQLIEKGLVSFVETQPKDLKISLWIKLKKNVRRILQSQIMNWLQLPFGLPSRRESSISEDLLFKTVWEGTDKYQAEIAALMKTERKWDGYAVGRRMYMFTIVSVLMVHGYQEGIDRREAEQKQKVEQVVAALESTKELPEMTKAYVKERKDTAFRDSIEQFKTELKRDPTPEEIEEMRAIIYK